MPRYRQVWNEEAGKSEFIEIGQDSSSSQGAAVHGDIRPFVSPVDGSVISDRKQLREHNLRNNVVNYHEFDGQKAPKTDERQESLKRKREIYERVIAAERQNDS